MRKKTSYTRSISSSILFRHPNQPVLPCSPPSSCSPFFWASRTPATATSSPRCGTRCPYCAVKSWAWTRSRICMETWCPGRISPFWRQCPMAGTLTAARSSSLASTLTPRMLAGARCLIGATLTAIWPATCALTWLWVYLTNQMNIYFSVLYIKTTFKQQFSIHTKIIFTFLHFLISKIFYREITLSSICITHSYWFYSFNQQMQSRKIVRLIVWLANMSE